MSFGACFCDNSLQLSYRFNNAKLNILLIPLCYGESSFKELHLDMPLHSSYMILQTRTFNHEIVSIGILNSRFFVILIYFFAHPCMSLHFIV